MRTYGRNAAGTWVEIDTDVDGNNDMIYIATLAQCLRLSPGEDPFNANIGIPSQQSVVTQLFPDFYVMQIQSYFAGFFASLKISRVVQSATANPASPIYNVNIMTHSGVTFSQDIAT